MKHDKVIPIQSGRPSFSNSYRADLAKERNIIGRKICEARKKAGLTQAALAELLASFGVSVQAPAVNKWERGESIPNAYQLMAVCHALGIDGGLGFFTGPVSERRETLNAEGLRMLNSYRQYLESRPRFQNIVQARTITRSVSLYPASAGFGDYLDGEAFEDVEFPENAVPDEADFAVPVDGDSMEPLYVDGQLAWIQKTEQLRDGEVGLFVVDGDGFIKTYKEEIPAAENYEDFIDSYGILHPQVFLVSQNKKYPPKAIMPFMNFRIIGRVLN